MHRVHEIACLRQSVSAFRVPSCPRRPMTNKSSLLSVLPLLQSRRILVLGDVMLDIFDFCRSAESKAIDSEKPGKRAYTAHESVQLLGGAGNVATNLVTLGAQATLVGLIGNDGHGHTVRALCAESGLVHDLARDPQRPTTTKTRLYIDEEYILRKDHESTADAPPDMTSQVLEAMIKHVESGVDAVILSDYNKGLFTQEIAHKIVHLCRTSGLPTVVDFKPANRSHFFGASLLVPNESEADALLPGFKGSDNLADSCQKLRAALGAESVVVTLGARGICGLSDSTGFFHHAGHKVKPVDAVGCGDTVRAMLALGLAAKLNLRQAAALANHAAAVIVQKPATATLTLAELEDFIRNS